ncbi:MAG: ABC transporter substrate-binding protein [Chloroflexota bacterium]
MKRTLYLLIALVLLAVVPARAQEGDWPRTLTDGLGTDVTIEAPPQRIVSLSLAVDETLLPVLGPERFAAVTAFAQDPAISNVAVLASEVENAIVSSDDVEQIISLEPDLVFVASFTAPETIQQLRDAGLTVFATAYAVGFDPVRENIRLLGRATGAEAALEAEIERMDQAIESVQQAVGDVDQPVRALYLTPGNYTSGVDSTIAEIIAAAGGVDVAAEMGIDQLAALSDEFIIEQDPDVILLTGWTPWDPTFVDLFYDNPAFAGLSAVQNERVYVTFDAHLTSVSQFIGEGVKDVAAYLYPDRYPAFPTTVIDASGAEVVIEAWPEAVSVAGEGARAAVTAILEQVPDSAVEVAITDIAGTSDTSDAPAVIFVSAADAPSGEGATVVRLYEGATDAERVANLLIAGAALGERVAALNAIAQHGDTVANAR